MQWRSWLGLSCHQLELASISVGALPAPQLIERSLEDAQIRVLGVRRQHLEREALHGLGHRGLRLVQLRVDHLITDHLGIHAAE